MIKLIKYLKNFSLAIMMIVLFLVIQALCELSLPDYTAKIVNVGIQQGGVEYAVPKIIRETELNRVLLFIDEENKNRVLEHYGLTTLSNLPENEYPALESFKNDATLVYLLEDVSVEELDSLSEILRRAFLIKTGLEQEPEIANEIVSQIKAGFPPGAFPEEADLFSILATLPNEQRTAIVEELNENMPDSDEIPDSIAEQAAMAAIKEEYQDIGIDMGKIQSRYIIKSGAEMLLITILSAFSSITVTLLSARVAAGLSKMLRKRLFEKVLAFSNAEYDKFSTASLITRSTNDIQQIQMMMTMLFRIIVFAPIMGIGGILKVFNTNGMMSWVIGVSVLAIFSLIVFLFAFAMPKFKLLQVLVDRVNLVAREILTGLPVIRAFNNVKHEEARFDKENKELTRVQFFVSGAMAFMMPTMMFIFNSTMILIIWVGAGHIDTGTMQVGDMMAFMQYAMQILFSFLMISMVSIMLPRASVSAKRIAEVLDTEITVHNPVNPAKFDGNLTNREKNIIEFKDVHFRYPQAEEDVLAGISFSAKPGETTAIIGSTGSGKSTIVNLIPRFYDVTGGEICINGVNIKDVSLYDLRDRLGFVPQKGVLFSGTIESNIKYGRTDAPPEEMEEAAKLAQAFEFISEKPDRFQSEISQGGTNVSGGQRQRLSIARAVVKKPDIYIFDDSFSALDFKTDAALRKALKQATENSIVIIVAQRINTILHAEQIIVLDEGRIAGKGTHKELMQNCEVYSQIALSQLSKEELDNE